MIPAMRGVDLGRGWKYLSELPYRRKQRTHKGDTPGLVTGRSFES
jgi:hypothetical protein